MAATGSKERKSFGALGLVVVVVGLLGMIFFSHIVFVLIVMMGGAVGAIDWRSQAGKAAAILAIVGMLVYLLMNGIG